MQNKRWTAGEGSYGNYVTVLDIDTNKTIARVPWGEGDCENVHLMSAAPNMLDTLKQIEVQLQTAETPEIFYKQVKAIMSNTNAVKKAQAGGIR